MCVDSLDRAIVARLKRDARTPFLKIAKDTGVSEGTIRNRVGDLLKTGTIAKFTVETGGNNYVSALVGIKADAKRRSPDTAGAIAKINGIASIFEVSGDFDMFAIIEAENLPQLNAIVDKARTMQGVRETQTFMVMNRIR
jgi:DNA-binding Lrp family transcriptional regulator